ncbi:MAG: S8 family serine peptidase, partial [Acidimicrobiales bacterium]
MTRHPRSFLSAVVVGVVVAASLLVVPVAASTGASNAAPTPRRRVAVRAPAWQAEQGLGSLSFVREVAGVRDAWNTSDARGRKVTGKDVGVALIDSGVTPVPGLDDDGLDNGPDLSLESPADNLRYLDTFGHGTHMAGIISGRDVGVAPDSKLLSLKVATSDGATDVSQVIAALDWVVQHRHEPGLDIRVINLSFGTQSTQDYRLDPLAYAVEAAWRKGIVVVISAGNDGNTTERLSDPAIDPYVIAVGAADQNGTKARRDDRVADFSSRGSAARGPDLVAPGRSLVSLRVPGSAIDQEHPSARVASTPGTAPRFFRGSGTSQSAAFVTGVVALLLQQRPELSPDHVKALLTESADTIPATDRRLQGAGLIDVKAAVSAPTPTGAVQQWPPATGAGSLEAARGASHVVDPEDGTLLTGEQDIFGQTWDGRSWAEASWAGRSW